MTAYLNPRLIATQGFALTPIALAVQGLLAILAEEEKRSQVYGSGRKLAVPADWNTAPIRESLQGPPDDALIDKVLEKWAAIEAANAARAAPVPDVGIPITDPIKPAAIPAPTLDTSPKLATLQAKPIAAIPAIDDTFALKAEQDRRNAQQIALIIALAEAL